ncbi:MAG TPA: hypothetical protein VGN43_14250 [Steroidobacteraceae bacterium]|nr:hypothetical protein [Steroidobacteraceae bacterium]
MPPPKFVSSRRTLAAIRPGPADPAERLVEQRPQSVTRVGLREEGFWFAVGVRCGAAGNVLQPGSEAALGELACHHILAWHDGAEQRHPAFSLDRGDSDPVEGTGQVNVSERPETWTLSRVEGMPPPVPP